MSFTIGQASAAVMNKWDWEDPTNNTPVFLWGSIGIGKTNLIQDLVAKRMIADRQSLVLTLSGADLEVAQHELQRLLSYDRPKEVEDLLDQHLLTLRLAERPIEQLQGVPAPDFENHRTVFLMPENVQKFQSSSWCVVFVDELDKADESKMTAATHLIEARRIGDFVFPRDTMIIAAANRVQDSFISKPIVPELRNRAAHIELEPDITVWVKWAKKRNLYIPVIRFLEYKEKIGENWLAVYDEDNASNYSTSFPTPRTWHMASVQCDRLIKRNKDITQKEILDELRQYVGAKATIEYETYFSLYSTIDIEDILTGKKRIPVYTDDCGKSYNAVLSDQYIYMYAICDQLREHHLDNEMHKENFIRFVFDINEELRNVFMQNTSYNDSLFKKMLTLKPLEAMFEQYIQEIMNSAMAEV
jgi:hypothetical protein